MGMESGAFEGGLGGRRGEGAGQRTPSNGHALLSKRPAAPDLAPEPCDVQHFDRRRPGRIAATSRRTRQIHDRQTIRTRLRRPPLSHFFFSPFPPSPPPSPTFFPPTNPYLS